MKKALIIGLIVIVLAGGGVYLYVSHHNASKPSSSNKSSTAKTLTPEEAAQKLKTVKPPTIQPGTKRGPTTSSKDQQPAPSSVSAGGSGKATP